LGAGDMNIVGEQFARLSLTLDQNGAGMTWFNGAGCGTFIYVPSMVIALFRVQKILGAEVGLALHDAIYVCPSLLLMVVSMSRSPPIIVLALSSCFVLLFHLFHTSQSRLCPHCEYLHHMASFHTKKTRVTEF